LRNATDEKVWNVRRDVLEQNKEDERCSHPKSTQLRNEGRKSDVFAGCEHWWTFPWLLSLKPTFPSMKRKGWSKGFAVKRTHIFQAKRRLLS
jgi:hypothetical protein